MGQGPGGRPGRGAAGEPPGNSWSSCRSAGSILGGGSRGQPPPARGHQGHPHPGPVAIVCPGSPGSSGDPRWQRGPPARRAPATLRQSRQELLGRKFFPGCSAAAATAMARAAPRAPHRPPASRHTVTRGDTPEGSATTTGTLRVPTGDRARGGPCHNPPASPGHPEGTLRHPSTQRHQHLPQVGGGTAPAHGNEQGVRVHTHAGTRQGHAVSVPPPVRCPQAGMWLPKHVPRCHSPSQDTGPRQSPLCSGAGSLGGLVGQRE